MVPSMASDVIVVGAGHNGLICAAYLARAGFDTVVLEARDEVGGCASTVTDLDARFNICNCDHTMIRAMPIADELDLDAHGLRYLENEVSSVHQFYDGSMPWLFFHDTDRHLDALALTYPDQVDGYRRYLAEAMPAARLALDIARTKPSTRRLTGTVIDHRGRGAARLLNWSRRSMADIMAQYFDDWRMVMPAVSTGPTVWGMPPDAPGTGTAALLYATRHLVRSGRPEGGSGALTDAIEASFLAAGGQTRCSARVQHLLIRDGKAIGVRLTDGTEVHARAVVAACDPARVFLDWLDDPPASARKLIDQYRARADDEGYESKIDAVLASLPTYRAAERLAEAGGGADLLGPTSIVSPSPDQLSEAHRLRREGRVAPTPTVLVNIPTVLDPAMQPVPDQHVMSLEVLYTPYSLAGGWAGSDEPARWFELLGALTVEQRLDVDRWRVMTPDRYEAEFSMHRGHTPSHAVAPLVAFVGGQRATTRYRAPVAGLYLTGAGTFPGAGIFGASGRNAADTVAHDLTHARRRDLVSLRRH